ncbi:hypothetical protein LOAG_12690 [Loa loa]|uniref:Uncharacterized protein n=1 Tax=Loa loa TaxID=7209 RepID=A0A1S0TKV3_LOALO|nr:hypothetical protein LOAG_12690 [Loa loa]EFO15820.1 hypothetical protein LOAG_12690 [Loa loa]
MDRMYIGPRNIFDYLFNKFAGKTDQMHIGPNYQPFVRHLPYLWKYPVTVIVRWKENRSILRFSEIHNAMGIHILIECSTRFRCHHPRIVSKSAKYMGRLKLNQEEIRFTETIKSNGDLEK